MGWFSSFIGISLFEKLRSLKISPDSSNIELQDNYFIKNYLRVLNDLTTLDETTLLYGERMIRAIKFLFENYSIPYSDESERKMEKINNYINRDFSDSGSTTITLYQRIWYNISEESFPAVEKTTLLISTPFSKKTVDGILYRYDGSGYCETILRANILTELIFELSLKLTTRDIIDSGYYFAPLRQKEIDEIYKEKKKKDKDIKKDYGDYWDGFWSN